MVTSDDDNTHNPSPGSLRCGVSFGGSNLGSGIYPTGLQALGSPSLVI